MVSPLVGLCSSDRLPAAPPGFDHKRAASLEGLCEEHAHL